MLIHKKIIHNYVNPDIANVQRVFTLISYNNLIKIIIVI